LYNFQIHWEKAGQITVAGDFNGWNSKLCQLVKDPRTNIWSKEIDIIKPEDENISTIKFKFVVNDWQWVTNY
jgi:hypothetical protein